MSKKIVWGLFGVYGAVWLGVVILVALFGQIDIYAVCALLGALILLLVGLARSLRGVKRFTKRKTAYEAEYQPQLGKAFVEENRAKWRNRLLLAVGDYNDNRFLRAETALKNLLAQCRSDDDYAAIYSFLALIYTDMGRTDEAVEAYLLLLKRAPDRSYAQSNLGLLYTNRGEYEKALTCYQAAVACDDSNPYAHNNLATLYYRRGQYEKAVEEGKKALERKETLYQAANVVCFSYRMLGDEENAQRYYRLAVSNGSDAAELDRCLAQMGTPSADDARQDVLPETVRRAAEAFTGGTATGVAHMILAEGGQRSRLGGAPLGEVPKDSRGLPMHQLCVLDCSEIHGVPDFPTEGLLRFFIADNDTYGADFDDPTAQKDFRVLYTELTDLAVTEQTPPGEDFPVIGCQPIRWRFDRMAMTEEDYRFRSVMDGYLEKNGGPSCDEMEDELFEKLCETFHAEGHRVGGYPHFTQYDPREEREEWKQYDRLLLQLNTEGFDGADKVLIGDVGVLNFFISGEALKKRDFSDVLYWWDCY